MRWIFFHGVGGGWGWEQLDDRGQLLSECHHSFETREEAEADASLRGYRAFEGVTPPVAHGS